MPISQRRKLRHRKVKEFVQDQRAAHWKSRDWDAESGSRFFFFPRVYFRHNIYYSDNIFFFFFEQRYCPPCSPWYPQNLEHCLVHSRAKWTVPERTNTCPFCFPHPKGGHRRNPLKRIIIISDLLHDDSLLLQPQGNSSLVHVSITELLLFIYWYLRLSEFLNTSCNWRRALFPGNFLLPNHFLRGKKKKKWGG